MSLSSFSVKLKVLIFISSAAAPLPDPLVLLCSPCTMLYPFLSHMSFHSFTLARLPLFSCMKRTCICMCSCAHLCNFLIFILCIFFPSSFPFNLLTWKVAISSFSGPSPGYPSVYYQSNTTRAARAAQGCTDDSVRMGAGSLMCE